MKYEEKIREFLGTLRKQGYPKEFIDRLKALKGKRSQTVVLHILKHGSVTTEELKSVYGYHHPPRARRDVIEQGIPLKTIKVRNSKGRRTIAAYTLGDPAEIRKGITGREVVPKALKKNLLQKYTAKCMICNARFDERYLQVDHRIPYEIAGKVPEEDPEAYMLLCRSCNRAKSWSCEHCANWREEKNSKLCRSCYWGSPDLYTHIALQGIRRLDIAWYQDDVQQYERLKQHAIARGESMSDYVKRILEKHLKELESSS